VFYISLKARFTEWLVLVNTQINCNQVGKRSSLVLDSHIDIADIQYHMITDNDRQVTQTIYEHCWCECSTYYRIMGQVELYPVPFAFQNSFLYM